MHAMVLLADLGGSQCSRHSSKIKQESALLQTNVEAHTGPDTEDMT